VELLAAQRWMDRLIAHSYRFSNVMYERLLEVLMNVVHRIFYPAVLRLRN
jgi:hypothetical protein